MILNNKEIAYEIEKELYPDRFTPEAILAEAFAEVARNQMARVWRHPK